MARKPVILPNLTALGASRMQQFSMFVMVGLAGAASAGAAPVQRIAAPKAPIASSVAVPAGSRLVYVSGTVPDPLPVRPSSGPRFGDTEAQTRSVLGKVDAELKRHGLGLGDVVMMRVFLVAPAGQQRMDFAGMMRGYSAYFGTPAQPNKPARSTMQVAGLVDPEWLVEIEVIATQQERH